MPRPGSWCKSIKSHNSATYSRVLHTSAGLLSSTRVRTRLHTRVPGGLLDRYCLGSKSESSEGVGDLGGQQQVVSFAFLLSPNRTILVVLRLLSTFLLTTFQGLSVSHTQFSVLLARRSTAHPRGQIVFSMVSNIARRACHPQFHGLNRVSLVGLSWMFVDCRGPTYSVPPRLGCRSP